MANVIPLAPHRRVQPSEGPAAARQDQATILFFTGVRYERQDETAAADSAVPRRTRALTPASGPKGPRKANRARQPA